MKTALWTRSIEPDSPRQCLEPRIVSEAVEIWLHVQADEVGATPPGTVLEERDCCVSLVDLCVTAGGRFKQAALEIRFAALAEERSKTRTLKGACDGSGLLGVRRRRLAQGHRFLKKPLVPERSFQPEQRDAKGRVERERSSRKSTVG